MAAAVAGEEEVLPITIPEAIESLKRVIVDVTKKNQIMIGYYIYPRQTPSELEAYKPRLQVLYARIESLEGLDLTKLTLLVDDAAALVSAFLLPITEQLLNAVHGVQQIFINHYDRTLEQRKPYGHLYTTLDYREKQLHKFQSEQMRNPQRRLPETLSPTPSKAAEPSFCRFAIAFTNHRDHGKLSQVLYEDLASEDRDRLRNNSGAFLAWDCPGCAFRLKYHVANSVAASIQATDDIRSHSSIPEVEYRPSWLVKCHLYQPKSSESDPRDLTGRRESMSTFESRRNSTVRRKSDARGARTSNPFFFGATRRKTSDVVTEQYIPSATYRTQESLAKYGCPFCFVTGKEYGHMSYQHGRDLAEHIAARHNLGHQPSGLMLEKYMIGMNGKCADNVRRWDLNIKPRY